MVIQIKKLKLTKICKSSVTVLDYIDIKHFNHCIKFYWTALLLDPLSEKKEGTSSVSSYKIDYATAATTTLSYSS